MCRSGGTITRAARIFMMAFVCGLTAHVYGFAGGTGEPNDPYQVATIEDLLAIGSSEDLLTKHYVLVNDLDLDPNLPGGHIFDRPLIAANDPNDPAGELLWPFSGVLDGRGHTIRNLHVLRAQGLGTGLIGWSSGVIKNLHMRDVRIDGSVAGALVGYSNGGAILRCTATGQISGSQGTGGVVGYMSRGVISDCRAEVQVRGASYAGGLFGNARESMAVRCEATGNVQGDRHVGGLGGYLSQCTLVDSRAEGVVVGIDFVGGLVGHVVFSGNLLRCGAVCEVTAERTAGGLIGAASWGTSLMDCYARGSVAGSCVGGLAGENIGIQVVNSYVACRTTAIASLEGTPGLVGGFFGQASSSFALLMDGSFWDMTVAGVDSSSGQGDQYPGTGLPTDQMQQRTTFEQADWDFASTWTMSEGGYPVLQWESDGN